MTYKNMSILMDVTKCIGCEECVKACRERNGPPPDKPWRWVKKTSGSIDLPAGDGASGYGQSERRFVRQAMPTLSRAGLRRSLYRRRHEKTRRRAGHLRPRHLHRLSLLLIACPWEIPRYSWEDTVPYVQKCDFCYRACGVDAKVPACIEACPNQATVFGARDELLAEAHRRLAAEPDEVPAKGLG